MTPRYTSALQSMERELAELGELVRSLVGAPLAITSSAEAAAISAFLLATKRGQRAAFQHAEPFAWRITQRVLARVAQSRGDGLASQGRDGSQPVPKSGSHASKGSRAG